MFDLFNRLPRVVQGLVGTGAICLYLGVAAPPPMV